MSYSLIEPGRRRNASWLVRWTDPDGRDREYSTGTADKKAAREAAPRIIAAVHEGRVPGHGEAVSFERCAELYIDFRRPAADDLARIERLLPVLGKMDCRDIGQAALDSAAATLYPTQTNETRNRQVYTPAITILNYAALEANGWASPRKWVRPKMKRPETRATAEHVGGLLYDNTQGKQRLAVAWWFRHGTRISDSLRQQVDKIDLRARTYEQYVSKIRRWKTFGLDDEVWELLANDAEMQRGSGLLFPWKNRWAVYDWLYPLLERLGLREYEADPGAVTGRRVVRSEMTPHMARHRLGKDLNAGGAGQKTIAAALGQLDVDSAARYTAEDIQAVRAARARVPKLGKTG